jgi:hypothetical protein
MNDDLEIDEEVAMTLMLIPLMWASKMMRANMEFISDLKGMPIDDLMGKIRDRKPN